MSYIQEGWDRGRFVSAKHVQGSPLLMLCIKIHHSLSSNQNLSFQMMCGTDPFPKDFKAKKYRQAAIDVRKALFVHSVCAFGLNTHSVCTNFSLNTHSVCTNFGLIVHSPVYSVILLKKENVCTFGLCS